MNWFIWFQGKKGQERIKYSGSSAEKARDVYLRKIGRKRLPPKCLIYGFDPSAPDDTYVRTGPLLKEIR